MSVISQILSSLGDERVKLSAVATGHVDAAEAGQGRGLTQAALSVLVTVPMWTPLVLSPTRTQTETPGAPIPTLCYHAEHAEVLFIGREQGTIRPLFGTVHPTDDGLALDGRGEAAAVQIVTERGEHVVITHNGVTTVYDLDRPSDPSLDELRKWKPEVFTWSQEPPSMAHLIADLSCQPWLRDTAGALQQSVLPLDRFASAGLLARLWEPGDRTERQAVIEGRLEQPASRALAWVKNLSEKELDELERLAEVEASSLIDDLAELDRAAAEDPDSVLLEVARSIIVKRDNLASAQYLLLTVKRGRQLSRLLAEADRAAVVRLSAFPERESFEDDPRLQAVFVTEPDAWWGAFGGV